jgi:hypothetical protein
LVRDAAEKQAQVPNLLLIWWHRVNVDSSAFQQHLNQVCVLYANWDQKRSIFFQFGVDLGSCEAQHLSDSTSVALLNRHLQRCVALPEEILNMLFVSPKNNRYQCCFLVHIAGLI